MASLERGALAAPCGRRSRQAAEGRSGRRMSCTTRWCAFLRWRRRVHRPRQRRNDTSHSRASRWRQLRCSCSIPNRAISRRLAFMLLPRACPIRPLPLEPARRVATERRWSWQARFASYRPWLEAIPMRSHTTNLSCSPTCSLRTKTCSWWRPTRDRQRRSALSKRSHARAARCLLLGSVPKPCSRARPLASGSPRYVRVCAPCRRLLPPCRPPRRGACCVVSCKTL